MTEEKRVFTPIFDRVLIKRHDSNLKKKTEKVGLILPDTVNADYKASEGTLVKCGGGVHESVADLLGKTVLFNRFSGDEIKLNGEEFVLCADVDVFGGLE